MHFLTALNLTQTYINILRWQQAIFIVPGVHLKEKVAKNFVVASASSSRKTDKIVAKNENFIAKKRRKKLFTRKIAGHFISQSWWNQNQINAQKSNFSVLHHSWIPTSLHPSSHEFLLSCIPPLMNPSIPASLHPCITPLMNSFFPASIQPWIPPSCEEKRERCLPVPILKYLTLWKWVSILIICFKFSIAYLFNSWCKY